VTTAAADSRPRRTPEDAHVACATAPLPVGLGWATLWDEEAVGSNPATPTSTEALSGNGKGLLRTRERPLRTGNPLAYWERLLRTGNTLAYRERPGYPIADKINFRPIVSPTLRMIFTVRSGVTAPPGDVDPHNR
jgi:hypothetical protein